MYIQLNEGINTIKRKIHIKTNIKITPTAFSLWHKAITYGKRYKI